MEDCFFIKPIYFHQIFSIWREREIVVYSNQAIPQLKLDQEWMHLMSEAKKAGFTINEIRDFLKQETTIQGAEVATVQNRHLL